MPTNQDRRPELDQINIRVKMTDNNDHLKYEKMDPENVLVSSHRMMLVI